MASPPVSRILCPYGRRSSIWGLRCRQTSVRPTRGLIGGPPTPLFGLAPGGVYQPPRSPEVLVVSYTTVSPLPVPVWQARQAIGGLVSVALFRRVAPPGCYPAPCPMESGLSSTACGIARSRDRLADSPFTAYISARSGERGLEQRSGRRCCFLHDIDRGSIRIPDRDPAESRASKMNCRFSDILARSDCVGRFQVETSESRQ